VPRLYAVIVDHARFPLHSILATLYAKFITYWVNSTLSLSITPGFPALLDSRDTLCEIYNVYRRDAALPRLTASAI